MGSILLAGGAEFGRGMTALDQQAIARAGGLNAPIRIIPTAAAPDNNHVRAGKNGVNWFKSLGANDVQSLPLIDKASAADDAIVEALRDAKLIYLLGGFPAYLTNTLKNSPAWNAVLNAYAGGAVVAGSSAGAMALCAFLYDPESGDVLEGLGLVGNVLVLPHHASFGKRWAAGLLQKLPGVLLFGLDECTGLLDDGYGENWSALGVGSVSIYQGNEINVYRTGETFHL